MARFAALAVAHRWANVTGPVELWFEPQALRIDLRGVRRHALGFAPLGQAHHTTVRVPYSAVRGLVQEGPMLLLALDPRAAAPYNRFALVRFAREVDGALISAHRLRAAAWALSWLAPLLAAAWTAVAIPRALVGGPVGIAALATLTLVVTRLALSRVTRWLEVGGPASERMRDDFERRMGERLGLEPPVVPFVEPIAPAANVPAVFGAVSRPRWLGLVVALAVGGALASTFVLRKYGVAARVRLPVASVRSGLTARLPGLWSATRRAVTPSHPACTCARASSPLYAGRLPRLSIVVSPRRGDLDSVWLVPDAVHPIRIGDGEITELDVGVVNNSNEPIRTVSVVVTFWRRVDGARRNITERGLYWPDVLGPGESVKWRIHARGNELRVKSYVPGVLVDPAAAAMGDSKEPAFAIAPVDAFAALERASLMSVRLHGAMMLAYLGDARAAAATRALGPLTPLEERARSLMLEANRPLTACDIDDQGACIMNRSSELVRAFTVREGDAETRFADLLFPGAGLRVPLPKSGDQSGNRRGSLIVDR
jgi:hypothetical protein